ncbi:TIGR01777 family oxidoreductase [Parahalioglobus pacificus]|uniref:Epimerase n=1 Tax=Parahalioglobus pacificus TaxID=930806 RepID=A0A918XFQ4_9GAMM|nr:TIGR01777 family oxidoreductase [Halioglobus pacificus]GHD29951.1 epimerase [Halioglobus pacificus]
MHVLITGGTGFIGSSLVPALMAQGHNATVLSRNPAASIAGAETVTSLAAIGDEARIDAIINLAGASLADKRWSITYKRQIVDSRIDTTRAIGELVTRLQHKPTTLISGSAIGYYGACGDEPLDETSAAGEGFAAVLCQDWEAAGSAISDVERTVLLRLGVVLDSGGGALTEMARPFRIGVANYIGSGHQFLSWIHREDVVAAIIYALENPSISGPVNLTAPHPVTSLGFCAAMKKRTRTMITLPMPSAVMRLMVGEMADELLSVGQRVLPAKLQSEGFQFRYPHIDAALEASL